jgi:hypothetical protein
MVVLGFGPQGQVRAVSSYDSNSSLINVGTEYGPTSVDKRFFHAERSVVVERLGATVTVAGTDGAGVSAVIRKVPNGVAIGSGTVLHSGCGRSQLTSLASSPTPLA